MVCAPARRVHSKSKPHVSPTTPEEESPPVALGEPPRPAPVALCAAIRCTLSPETTRTRLPISTHTPRLDAAATPPHRRQLCEQAGGGAPAWWDAAAAAQDEPALQLAPRHTSRTCRGRVLDVSSPPCSSRLGTLLGHVVDVSWTCRARPAARAQSRRGTCGGAPGQHRGRATCESAAEHLVAVSANQVALRRVIDGTSSCEAGVTMTGRAIAACKPAAFRAGKTGTAAAHPSPGAKASSSLHPTGSRRASVSSSALT